MKALLDTNVALDLLLWREPFANDATAIFQANRDQRFTGLICATSVTTVFYIAARQAGKSVALEHLRNFLAILEVAPVDRSVIEAALASPGADFEDNVVAESARQAGADAIVTRDAAGFRESPCPPLAPAQFLALIRGDDG